MIQHLTVNLWVILAIVGLIAGVVLLGYGFIGAMDPEGRGAPFDVLSSLIGLVLIIVSVLYLLYRLGAVFGFWS